jgi:hypothetical protein
MTTDVSSTPRAGRGLSATGRRALVGDGVQIGPELAVIDGRGGAEQRHRSLGSYEPVAPQRGQLADRHAVAGHDERLPSVKPAHDLAAVIAEFSLGDLFSHVVSVARRATEALGG